MRTRMGLMSLLLIAGILMGGCMSTPAGVSSSTIPLTQGGYTEIGPTKGRAVGIILLGIPISEPYPARAAIDRAVEAGGGDAMVNVTVDMTQIPLFIVNFIFTTVNGTAVKTIK